MGDIRKFGLMIVELDAIVRFLDGSMKKVSVLGWKIDTFTIQNWHFFIAELTLFHPKSVIFTPFSSGLQTVSAGLIMVLCGFQVLKVKVMYNL